MFGPITMVCYKSVDTIVLATWDIRSQTRRLHQCPGYLGYPFQYMCADDELHPYLFLFIHIMGKLFHIALYPLILERISQVASTRGACGLTGCSGLPE